MADSKLNVSEQNSNYIILNKTEDEMLEFYKSLSEEDKVKEDQRLKEDPSLTDDERIEISKGISDDKRFELYSALLTERRLKVDKILTYEERLKIDEKRAIKKGYVFEIATKEGRGKPWITAYENITPLSYALELANNIEAYETGVFLEGSIYWKSKCPELNFHVIYS